MAIATTQISVTSQWQKVSEGDITLQSETEGVLYDFAVGVSEPSTARLWTKMDAPTTIAYKEPVWLRLSAKGPVSHQRLINVIK